MSKNRKGTAEALLPRSSGAAQQQSRAARVFGFICAALGLTAAGLAIGRAATLNPCKLTIYPGCSAFDILYGPASLCAPYTDHVAGGAANSYININSAVFDTVTCSNVTETSDGHYSLSSNAFFGGQLPATVDATYYQDNTADAVTANATSLRGGTPS